MFDSSNMLSSETFYERESEFETNVDNEEDIIRRLISQLSNEDSELPDTCRESPNRVNDKGVKLKDPPDLEQILSTEEDLITPTSHNVSIINGACQQILKQMENQLLALLKKNRKEQDLIQTILNSNCKNLTTTTSKKSSLKCVGIPYFKDIHGFPAPSNEDVVRKKSNQKLLPIDLIKGFSVWSSTDAKNLENAVRKFNVLNISEIDWMKISVADFDGKFSPTECKAKWVLHLNSSINRSKWTLKEKKLLKTLSAKYNYQDWDKIASDLGTNRTGLQCCIQYQTSSSPTEGKWTKEEDETLQKLVDMFRVKDYIPWTKVAWHFESRSLRQCKERYSYRLGNIKKGMFTVAEDFVIVYLASKLKNFGEVAKYLPNRVATQVRARYEYLVALSMPNFTEEEDELLTKLMIKYPRNWGKISEHFSNRSRIQCRKRWAFLQKSMKLEDDFYSEVDDEDTSLNLPLHARYPIITIKTQYKSNNQTPTRCYNKSPINPRNVKKNYQLLSVPSPNVKKYPEIYCKFLDYHKHCHKFLFGPKPRIPHNLKDLESLTTKMILAMQVLSVDQIKPFNDFNLSSLSNNCEFDNEDAAVLQNLTENEVQVRDITKKFIPPNYMTLVALRTFLMGWNQIKTFSKLHQDSPQTSTTDSDNRVLCNDAKKLFKDRLKAILAFPLLLSNIFPSKEEIPIHKPKSKKSKPMTKGKRKKHAKYMSATYRNKLKALKEQCQSSDSQLIAEELSKSKKPKKIKLGEKSDNTTEKMSTTTKKTTDKRESEADTVGLPLKKKSRLETQK